MGRNHAAINDDAAMAIHALDQTALQLARYVYNRYTNTSTLADGCKCGGIANTDRTMTAAGREGKPKSMWSIAEFCFFTLVFRHTRVQPYMDMSLVMLNAALTIIPTADLILPPSHGLGFTDANVRVPLPPQPMALFDILEAVDDAGISLLQRFAAETVATMETTRVKQYTERALSRDVPYVLTMPQHGTPDVHVAPDTAVTQVGDCSDEFALNNVVLDDRCDRGMGPYEARGMHTTRSCRDNTEWGVLC